MKEWRSIAGFEGRYRISNSGEVYSHWSRRNISPFLVKGYPVVSLRMKGKRINGRIHTLVAEAFIGPRPAPNLHCAHLDGNPLNNRADNLSWVTPSENEKHKQAHGSDKRGERSHHAKLTDEQASLVRFALTRPLRRREVAALVGVSERTIDAIAAGQTYRPSGANSSKSNQGTSQ